MQKILVLVGPMARCAIGDRLRPRGVCFCSLLESMAACCGSYRTLFPAYRFCFVSCWTWLTVLDLLVNARFSAFEQICNITEHFTTCGIEKKSHEVSKSRILQAKMS